MQIPSPAEAQNWGDTIERGGVVLLLLLVIVTILRKWFVPWYVVEMKDARIKQLEEREEMLLELALRGTSAAETSLSVIKQRR
jgi:hypothetical protein